MNPRITIWILIVLVLHMHELFSAGRYSTNNQLINQSINDSKIEIKISKCWHPDTNNIRNSITINTWITWSWTGAVIWFCFQIVQPIEYYRWNYRVFKTRFGILWEKLYYRLGEHYWNCRKCLEQNQIMMLKPK